VSPSIVNELLPWTVAILSFAAALSAIWFATRQEPVALPVVISPIELNAGEEFDRRAPALAIAPSGRSVAWSACRAGRCQLHVRSLEHLGSTPLPGTDGASAPFFSPDELWIGFFADGKLKKVFVRGGGAVTITEASQPFGATWLPGGMIVFAPSAAGGLMRVHENGGPVVALTTPSAASGELSHAFPSLAPGSDGIIFVIRTSPLPDAPGRLALLPHARSEQTSWRVLVDRVNIGGAVGTEFLAFVRDGGLSAVGYDFLRQTASGAPHVIEGAIMSPHLALSPSGSMATVGVHWTHPSTPSPPTWSWNLATAAAPERLPSLYQAALSPDARQLAGIDPQSPTDVWTVDLERSIRVRLTYNAVNVSPAWSADSSTIFYASRRQGAFEIWSRRASAGNDETRVLAKANRHLFPSSVSADGAIAFVETGGATRSDVGIHRGRGSGTQMIAQTPFDEVAPAISNDGTMLAYQSDESGQWEITVVRLGDGRRHVVSRGGGVRPLWSHDGRLLYFEQGGSLVTVTIDPSRDGAGAAIVASRLNGASPVGIAPSGAVLLHRAGDPHLRVDSAAVTVNWIQHLRRTLLPPLPTTTR
jgi:Tol biopolymer transport system component